MDRIPAEITPGAPSYPVQPSHICAVPHIWMIEEIYALGFFVPVLILLRSKFVK